MDADSREFGLFIDGLRLERNMSREDLCEGIISLSQYKRYLRGDTSIPNDKLVLLADRLKFSISDIHIMYNRKSDKQYQQILKVYNLIQGHNFKAAHQEALKLKDDIFLSDYNEMFHRFCLLNAQHNLGMVSDVHVLQIYSEMINYPECSNSASFNWVELNILLQIVKISSKMGNTEPADLLYQMMMSDGFELNFNRQENYIPYIYLTLSQLLGSQERYSEVIDLTNRAIEYCISREVASALSHLLLINAFAYWDSDKKDQAIESAKKTFMLLYIENKPQKMMQFKQSFEGKFEMKLDDLIKF